MIFISAQPDDDYFLWQLKVQVKNLQSLGFTGEYHMLIRVGRGQPNPKFLEWEKELKGTNFKLFPYWDTREDYNLYLPSMRPYMLAQHYSMYRLPEVFYIDSDIIFRELPDFSLMAEGNWCSDTASYVGAQYIISKGMDIFTDMCSIVGIDPELVIRNEANSGGAQYVIRGVDVEFWMKVEQDCKNLYRYGVPVSNRVKENGLQVWTADMWAVLWNLWLVSDCKVSHELSFCWPTQPIEEWNKHKILHNAGVTAERAHELFHKAAYNLKDPTKEDLSFVNPKYCSYIYAQAIKAV